LSECPDKELIKPYVCNENGSDCESVDGVTKWTKLDSLGPKQVENCSDLFMEMTGKFVTPVPQCVPYTDQNVKFNFCYKGEVCKCKV